MNTDLNVLPWYDRLQDQERFNWYAYGQISCIPQPSNLLPAWQKTKPRTGAPVDAFTIVNIETGDETDILTEMIDTGLQVLQPEGRNYDIIMYPSTVRMNTDLPGDIYYAVMSSGGKTWYSGLFGFRPDMNGFIKLEWCHHGNFEYTGGHIQYTSSGFGNGYKNYLWIEGTLAKPIYPSNKEFDQRGGRKFPTFHYTSKEYKLIFKASESVLDALRVVDQHDVVKMHVDGRQYDVDEFLFNQEWSSNGDIATVAASIFTDVVIVETIATGAPSSETCEIGAGSCIPPTGSFYVAKSHVTEGSMEWDLGYYYDSDGNTTNLDVGDYVTAGASGLRRLYQYNSPNNYTLVSLSGFYTKIYYANTDEYWYDRGEGLNIRESRIKGFTDLTSPPTFYGQAGNGDGVIYELWLEDAGGAQIFVQRTTEAELNAGVQIDSSGYEYLLLRSVTIKCGTIMESKFMIPDTVITLTNADDDGSIILTNADDDDTITLGSVDTP